MVKLHFEDIFIMIVIFLLDMLYLNFFVQELALNGGGEPIELLDAGLFDHLVLSSFLFVQILN